jgi:hypothetical protein
VKFLFGGDRKTLLNSWHKFEKLINARNLRERSGNPDPLVLPIVVCKRPSYVLGLACNGLNLAGGRGCNSFSYPSGVDCKLVYQGTTGTATGALSEIFVWMLISS